MVAVFITHGHYDHVANLDRIIKRFKIKAYLTVEAFKKLNNDDNCSSYFELEYKTSLKEPDFVFVEDGTSLNFIEDYPIQIYRTKGHTDCGVCIKFGEDILFSGDTIFYRTFGRTDLPTGDSETMVKTLEYIREKFKGYTVYAGHGRSFVL